MANRFQNQSGGQFGASQPSSPPTAFYYDNTSLLRFMVSGESIRRFRSVDTGSETWSSSHGSRAINNALRKNELHRHSQPALLYPLSIYGNNGTQRKLPAVPGTSHDDGQVAGPSTSNDNGQQEPNIRRLPVLPFQHMAANLAPAARKCAYNLLLDKLLSGPGCENPETGGITLCGGLESGNNYIYISRVSENSAGAMSKLEPGDQVLSANYMDLLSRTSLNSVYNILINNGNPFVWMTILPRAHAMTITKSRNDDFTWIDFAGRSTSPPPPDEGEEKKEEVRAPVEPAPRPQPARRLPRLRDILGINHLARNRIFSRISNFTLFRGNNHNAPPPEPPKPDFRQITINVKNASELGLIIKGGWEYGLAIYVAQVRPGSLAERNGLQFGDRILSVNNCNFDRIFQDQAKDVIRSVEKYIVFRVRYVGKVPAHLIESEHHMEVAFEPEYANLPANYSIPRAQTPARLHVPTPLMHTMSTPCSSTDSSASFTLRGALRPVNSHNAMSYPSILRPSSAFPTYLPQPAFLDEMNRGSSTGNDADTEDMYVSHAERERLTRKRSFRGGGNGSDRRISGLATAAVSVDAFQLLQEKSMNCLTNQERMTLDYYCNEYQADSITIEVFTGFILELLNTKEKYSLLGSIRLLLRSSDVARFNQLVYRHEVMMVQKSKTIPNEFKGFYSNQDSTDSSINESFSSTVVEPSQMSNVQANVDVGRAMSSVHNQMNYASTSGTSVLMSPIPGPSRSRTMMGAMPSVSGTPTMMGPIPGTSRSPAMVEQMPCASGSSTMMVPLPSAPCSPAPRRRMPKIPGSYSAEAPILVGPLSSASDSPTMMEPMSNPSPVMIVNNNLHYNNNINNNSQTHFNHNPNHSNNQNFVNLTQQQQFQQPMNPPFDRERQTQSECYVNPNVHNNINQNFYNSQSNIGAHSNFIPNVHSSHSNIGPQNNFIPNVHNSHNNIVPHNNFNPNVHSSHHDIINPNNFNPNVRNSQDNIGPHNNFNPNVFNTHNNISNPNTFNPNVHNSHDNIGPHNSFNPNVHNSRNTISNNFNPVDNSIRPNSAAYRRIFMSRRHSSGASEAVDPENMRMVYSSHRRLPNDFIKLGVSNNAPSLAPVAAPDDERRWSVSVHGARRSSNISNAEYTTMAGPSVPRDLAFGHHHHRHHHHHQADQRMMVQDNNQVVALAQQVNSDINRLSVMEQNAFLYHLPQQPLQLQEQQQLPQQYQEQQHQQLQQPQPPPAPPQPLVFDQRRNSGNHLHVPNPPGMLDAGGELSEEYAQHMQLRRYRSLPSPSSSIIIDQLIPPDFPRHQRSNSFRLPSYRVIAEPGGRFRIRVRKNRPFMGMAIENSGIININTPPRIRRIYANGSAAQSGLRVGHYIIEVNGRCIEHMDYLEAAQLISTIYYNTLDTDYMEFVVRETAYNELEQPEASLMLLDNNYQ